MKQVFFTSGGEVAVLDVPPPVVGPKQVFIAVEHSLVSTGTELASSGGGGGIVQKVLSDPMIVMRALDYARKHGIKTTYQLATGQGESSYFPLGYSIAGRVVEVGREVSGIQVGDRVAAAGAGLACHAEFVSVPVNLVVKAPVGLSSREACFGTLGAIALQGVRRCAPTLGETVLVVGLGLLGQLAVRLLVANGARVIGVDLREDRVRRALEHGAREAFSPGDAGFVSRVMELTGGVGADAAVLTAATKSSEIINQAANACRRKGRVVIVGDVGLDIARESIYAKEIDILISTSYGPGRYDSKYEFDGIDYPLPYVRWTENRNIGAFLDLVAEGRVKVDDLVTIEEPVAQAVEVYRRLSSGGQNQMAAVFRYPTAASGETPGRPSGAVRLTPKPKSAKLSVALIGVGGYASAFHVPNFGGHPDVRIGAVVSTKGVVAQQVAQKHGAALAATDYREAVADAGIDGLVISTRHDTHAEIAVAALTAGKHVFVEKPVALTRDDVSAVYRAAVAGGAPITVGHNRRFSPHAKLLADLRAGTPGPVQMVYTVNAGALPANHWANDPVKGGGRIIGEGCHFFDLMYFLANAAPVRVAAMGVPESTEPKLWQNVSVVVRFADGSVGNLTYSALGHGSYAKERVELYAGGSVGVLDDYQSAQVFGAKPAKSKTAVIDKGQKTQVDDWIAHLCGRPATPISTRDSMVGTWIALAAIESLMQGRAIPIDLNELDHPTPEAASP